MDQSCWKILMVDDDEEDYLLTRQLLSEAKRGKYSLDWASTYENGLTMLLGNHYDAILVDYLLGPDDGLELTRQAVESGCRTPIVLFTSMGDYDTDQKAMQAGASLYLAKGEANSVTLERCIHYAIHHKQTETRLLENEARYRKILNTLPVGIGVFDAKGKLIESNHVGCRIMQGEFDEPGLPAVDIGLPGEPRADWDVFLQKQLLAEVLQGKTFESLEMSLEYSNGTTQPVLVSASPVKDSNGGITGAVMTCVDISERRQLEEELKESEKKYRELVRYAPAGIYEVDFRRQRFLSVNDAMCELSGYSREELLNMNPFDILDEEGKILFSQRIQSWLAGEEPSKNVEYKVKAKDGHLIYTVLNTAFTKDAVGIPLGATVIAFDITERRQAEEVARESQKYITRLIDTSFEGIWSVDQYGVSTFINNRAAEILDYTIEEIKGRSAFEFLMAEDIEAGRQTLEYISQGKSGRVEAHARRKDGSPVWLLVSFSPIHDDQGQFQGALAMFTDITERKQVEESLRESEERFRTMADGTPMLIWVTDPVGKNIFINRVYSEFFGVSIEHVQKHGWQPMVHQDDYAEYMDVFIECLRQQKPFHSEARVRRADGEWRWVESFGELRYSPSGSFLGMAGCSIDITERKKLEDSLQSYTEQLKRSNQELENFAFLASHDLQEPLRKIEAFSRQLVYYEDSNLNETQRDYLNRMNNAASRMKKMIEGLLTLSRVTSRGMSFAPVDLNQVVQSVVDDLEIRIRQTGGRVVLDDLPVVRADSMQIHHLFQNLIGNALKFHRRGVPPEVKIWANTLPENQVEIHIEDNGIGFDTAHASQLFKPFHRLVGRAEFEGSGIGLSICAKIVERHLGAISAHGKPGEGAEFIVTIPAGQSVESV